MILSYFQQELPGFKVGIETIHSLRARLVCRLLNMVERLDTRITYHDGIMLVFSIGHKLAAVPVETLPFHLESHMGPAPKIGAAVEAPQRRLPIQEPQQGLQGSVAAP